MTLKHINFKDSPVMRELERLAIDDGTMNVEVEEVVKRASANKKVSYEPTEHLTADIMKLADGLRSRGYVDKADDLEKRFVLCKQAETHLYKVFEEDGEDLLDFAHPEGEVQIGTSEYGKIETTLTEAKKIRDIVNKVPTGKLASEASGLMKDAEDILGIKKNIKIGQVFEDAAPIQEEQVDPRTNSLNTIRVSKERLSELLGRLDSPKYFRTAGMGLSFGDEGFFINDAVTLLYGSEEESAARNKYLNYFMKAAGIPKEDLRDLNNLNTVDRIELRIYQNV